MSGPIAPGSAAPARLGGAAPAVVDRLARGLIAYGAIGLVLALLTALAVVIAIGRLGSVGDAVGGSTGQLKTVFDRTATVLDDVSRSAASVGSTIDASSGALTTAAADLRAIVPQLRDIESRANAISIFGSQPLAPIAGLFGQIAGQLGDLDTQLDGVATNLVANRAALTTNAASLAALAAETRALGQRIAPDAVDRAIADARWFAIALLAVVATGVALPAIAALVLGWWLRRELVRSAGPTPA